MNHAPMLRNKMSRFLVVMLGVSLVMAIAAFVVQPVTAAPPTPNVPCDDTCTYLGRTVFCNSSVCGGDDYVIQRFRCCNPCDGCYYYYNSVCMNDPYCG